MTHPIAFGAVRQSLASTAIIVNQGEIGEGALCVIVLTETPVQSPFGPRLQTIPQVVGRWNFTSVEFLRDRAGASARR